MVLQRKNRPTQPICLISPQIHDCFRHPLHHQFSNEPISYSLALVLAELDYLCMLFILQLACTVRTDHLLTSFKLRELVKQTLLVPGQWVTNKSSEFMHISACLTHSLSLKLVRRWLVSANLS